MLMNRLIINNGKNIWDITELSFTKLLFDIQNQEHSCLIKHLHYISFVEGGKLYFD